MIKWLKIVFQLNHWRSNLKFLVVSTNKCQVSPSTGTSTWIIFKGSRECTNPIKCIPILSKMISKWCQAKHKCPTRWFPSSSILVCQVIIWCTIPKVCMAKFILKYTNKTCSYFQLVVNLASMLTSTMHLLLLTSNFQIITSYQSLKLIRVQI